MFSNLFPPAVSGSSTQSAALARELARRGLEVSVITARVFPGSRPYEEMEGVHVYRLPAIRLPRMPISLNFPWLNCTFTPGNLARIRAIMRRHAPDVLHLHNHMFDLAFSATLEARRTGKPLIITIHTVIRHSRSLYNCLLLPTDRFLLKNIVVNRARAVICPDENIKEYVRTTFANPNAVLIPYGISLQRPPQNELVDQIMSKYGLHHKRVLLSVGHVHAIRNRKDLIEALPEVLKTIPNAVLLIVGAEADNSPRELAGRLGIADSVIFTGAVPHSHIPAYLEVAELEAHWLNQEDAGRTSLGIASLEAMGSGKAILAAANEHTYGRGVLIDGKNLVLVKPNDPPGLAGAILSLMCDEKRRRSIGEAGKITIKEHFSWENVCNKTLDTYHAVLSGDVSG
jgi:glycosyltransferase involved in cell wall biosynthesis